MQHVAPSQPTPAAPHPFDGRILMGVLGVFAAAMMSGLNSRIGGLSLVDVKTAFGVGSDEGSWIGSLYSAFELAAMPFATWFAVTFSFRRFHVSVVTAFSVFGLLTPLAPSFEALLALRCMQGFFGGLLIPVLMAAALRFFPLSLRLYGLALYAFMNFLVVPLSASPRGGSLPMSWTVCSVIAQVVLVGWPCAWFARRGWDGRWSRSPPLPAFVAGT